MNEFYIAAPAFAAKDEFTAWQKKHHPWLRLSDVYRATTDNIRVTVIPFYMGCRVCFIVLKERGGSVVRVLDL